MEQSKRFSKAYTALINAYHNNTLAKGKCIACAVGNIVAHSQNIKIKKQGICEFIPITSFNNEEELKEKIEFWKTLFITVNDKQKVKTNKVNEEKLFKLTGYTAEELAKVEFAFEKNTNIHYYDYHIYSVADVLEDQFKGLSAVLDVLFALDNMEYNTTLYADLHAHPGLENIKHISEPEIVN